jgi:ectoine hydroxylase-related dioxygenase (phytanoyl-CoA dioxygenase family)
MQSEFGSGGTWHRDGFFPEIKSILYLTDVDLDNGPFEYIAQSHVWSPRYAEDNKIYRFGFRQHRLATGGEAMLRREPHRHVRFTARAGTLVIFDTTGIHRGAPLKQGTRYALTNYYVDSSLVNDALYRLYGPIVVSRDSYIDPSGAERRFAGSSFNRTASV